MKIKKSLIGLILIIAVIILFAILLSSNDCVDVCVDDAKCIESKATLYVQEGCHACEKQEELFGDKVEYLDIVDCWYDRDKCIEKQITATPTWIIYGNKYVGVHSVEELKNLTGC